MQQPSSSLKTKSAGYLMVYGCFLMAMGLIGYLSNPEKARTALISGGTFGALSLLWGMLWARDISWSRTAAIGTTGLLIVVFAWRAGVGWLAVLDGNVEKRFAASLITAMLVGSALLLPILLKGKRSTPDKNQHGTPL